MNPRDLLDPTVAAVVDLMSLGEVTAESLPTLRATNIEVPLSDSVARTDHLVPGDPPVPIRVHRANEASGLLPGVYWIHGGGLVLGKHSMEDARFDDWCPRLGVVGVAVDYRLAPEAAYPAPLDDCYRGLLWTFEHAAELGIDVRRIGIGGNSAGGGLAVALALFARDRGEVDIAFQLLDSPMIDDRQITASSQRDGLAVWNRESNAFGWRSYLGDLYGSGDVPYTAAPARAEDLAGLPPAFVSVGALDGFLDEDVDYALRLNHAGVPTELHVYPGACHGFKAAREAPVVQQGLRDIEDWLVRQLSRQRQP